MADPIKVLQLLGTTPVSTYTVFERDQVLTHGQLNELSLYLNQQERLTRTNLVGVGVISGLDLAVEDAAVTVGPGLGITTDGDLVIRPEAVRYTHSKPYDDKQPRYAPFFPDGKTIFTLSELTDAQDPLGKPLPGSLSQQGWVVVLLVETTQIDPDLCIGENCDNLGSKAVSKIRLLLVSTEDAKALRANFRPVSERARSLPDLMSTRPSIDAGLTSMAVVSTRYRDACSDMLSSLSDALTRFAKDFLPELKALFGDNPVDAWQTRLKEVRDMVAIGNAQVIHAFFKDLVDTWNDLVEALLDTTAILLPGVSAFPKHLLLGSLGDPTALRTVFFPSVADTGAREAAARAGFLVRKLQALIKYFIVPDDVTLRVTPSLGEAVQLEERAIPWYYEPDISTQWSYRLNKRQQSEANMGYRANDYGGSTRARNPLAGTIAGYDMFRIEGHLGRNVNTVRDEMKALIAQHNLPFKVHAVLAHSLKRFIRIRPRIRYTDLHRFHYLLRQDVAIRLDESKLFTATLSENVRSAVQKQTIPDQLENTVSVSQVVQTARDNMDMLTAKAQPALGKTRYTEYQEASRQSAWTDSLGSQLQTLGDVRSKIGEVARNDIVSPIDSLIQTTHPIWLNWLDDLIAARDDHEDDKLLLSRFVSDHPSLDHLGGTWRGGTFVLLYNELGTVVGDFALPYPYEEVDEVEPDEPVLQRPPLLRPPIKDLQPIGIIRPIKLDLDRMVTSRVDLQIAESGKKLDDKIVAINADVDNRLKFTTANVESLVKGAFSVKDATAGVVIGGGRLVASGDTLLDELAQDVDYKRQRVQSLVDLVGRTDLSEDQRSKAKAMLTSAQGELGAAVGTTAEHVVNSKINTASGGAANVASILAQSTMLVTDSAASNKLTAKLGALEISASDQNQKVLIGGLKNIGAIRG